MHPLFTAVSCSESDVSGVGDAEASVGAKGGGGDEGDAEGRSVMVMVKASY